jgi:hypothetical protein
VLLSQLQDDLARSRKREAFWISLIFHILLVLAILFMPNFSLGRRSVALQNAKDLVQNRDYSFLELPPDLQKVTRPPKTQTLSDKDRVASSRSPKVDRKELDKLLNAQRPGAPGAVTAPTPPQPKQAAPPQVAHEQSPPGPASQPKENPPQAAPAPLRDSNAPVLQSLNDAARQVMGGSLSPGSAIQQAARASVDSRAGGSEGDYGLHPSDMGGVKSDLDILSDTRGVDFGPYLARVLHLVRNNWYNLIPEVARAPLMKQGKVSVEFAITKDG